METPGDHYDSEDAVV